MAEHVQFSLFRVLKKTLFWLVGIYIVGVIALMVFFELAGGLPEQAGVSPPHIESPTVGSPHQ